MNICFLCNEYPPATHGGIGRATRTLAQSLVESGHQVRVIGFTFLKEPVSNLEWDCGVAVHRLKFATSRFGWIRARRACTCYGRDYFRRVIDASNTVIRTVGDEDVARAIHGDALGEV